MNIYFVTGKTRISQARLAMLVLIPILELVSELIIAIRWLLDVARTYRALCLMILLLCHSCRAKQKRWSGISWLRAYVFFEGKVKNLIDLLYAPILNLNICLILFLWWFPCFSLPWQGLKAGTKKQKYDRISEKKMLTPIEVPSITFASCLLQAPVFYDVVYCLWSQRKKYVNNSLSSSKY